MAILPNTRPLHHVKSQNEPGQREPTETEALLDQNDNNSSEEMSSHHRDQGLIGLIREVKAKLSSALRLRVEIAAEDVWKFQTVSLCASCNSARGLQHSHLKSTHFGKIRLDFDTGKFLTADRHFTKSNNRIQAG